MGKIKTGFFVNCKNCLKEFYRSKSSIQQCCSHFCRCELDKKTRRRFFQKEIKCKICETFFYRSKNYIKSNKNIFCSKQCYRKFQLSTNNPLRIRKLRICEYCKKNFDAPNYASTKFCSIGCWGKYAKENRLFILPNSQKLKIEKICKSCNKKFFVWNYRRNAKFCSPSCYKSFHHITKICRTCKKTFSPPKHLRKKIYCNNSCAQKRMGKRKSKFSQEILEFIYSIKSAKKIESEALIKVKNNNYCVDILINDKLVIECYGDYWHCNPIKYQPEYFHTKISLKAKQIWKKDVARKNKIEEKGYKVLIIWEKDWNTNKEKARKNIVDFLK